MRSVSQSLRRATVALVAAVAMAAAIGWCPAAEAQSAPASSEPARPIDAYVAEAAQRFGVPEAWIYAVLHVESAGDLGATSTKGAMGLMQVMPATYADLRSRYRLGPDAYAPRDNILAGTAYLRELYDRYGAPGFLAAYNAGPGRYQDYLAGRALPVETRAYLTRLAPQIGGSAAAGSATLTDPLAWTKASLFAGGRTADAATLDRPPVLQRDGSSAVADQPAPVFEQHASASLFVALSGRHP